MSKLYELEQQIIGAWAIIDDLKVLLDVMPEDDKSMNILIGTIELYSIKFDKLFTTYEQVIAENAGYCKN